MTSYLLAGGGGGWEDEYFPEEVEEEDAQEEEDEEDDDDDRSVISGGQDLEEFARAGGFDALGAGWGAGWGGPFGEEGESLDSESDVGGEFPAELLSRVTGAPEGPPSPPEPEAVTLPAEKLLPPIPAPVSQPIVVAHPPMEAWFNTSPWPGARRSTYGYRTAIGMLAKELSELLQLVTAGKTPEALREEKQGGGSSGGAGGVLNLIDFEAYELEGMNEDLWWSVISAKANADNLFNRNKLQGAHEAYMTAILRLAEQIGRVPEDYTGLCVRLFCKAAHCAHLAHPLEDCAVRALRMAQAALQLDPGDVEALYCRGKAYRCIGIHSWASRDLTRVLELDDGRFGLVADTDAELALLVQDQVLWQEQAQEHQRFEIATLSRDEGNRLAASGQHQAASLEYLRGLDAFDGTEASELSTSLQSLQAQLLCLAGQALLKCEGMDGSNQMACSVATRALELEPKSTKALLLRGRAYCAGGSLDLACKDFQEVLRLDPFNVEAKQDLEQLADKYTAVEEGWEDRHPARRHRGGIWQARGRPTEQRVDTRLPAQVQEATMEPPPEGDMQLPSDVRQLAIDDAEGVPSCAGADLVEAAAMPQPGVSPLRAALEAQDLADHLAKQGLFRQSAAAFVRGLHALSLDEVSALGPRAHQARELRVELLEGAAESLLRCGEAEEVRALCTLAFEEDPRNIKAVSWRASASLQLQDFSLAREDLHQVLEMDPEDERAQAEMRQVEELLQLQEELETAESPESQVFGVMLEAAREDKHEANQHFSREQYGEAFGAYCRGIDRFGELKPHHLSSEARELKVALCCSAAQAALLFNDKESSGLEEALRTAQQALELEPGNVKALFRRGLVYSKTKKWTEARNDFQAVMVMDAKDSTQGQALVRRFQHQAEVELERIFEMTKRVPRQTDSGEDV